MSDPGDNVGKFFLHDGELYQCYGYCERPSLDFENVRTGRRTGGAVGSPHVNSFIEVTADKSIIQTLHRLTYTITELRKKLEDQNGNI